MVNQRFLNLFVRVCAIKASFAILPIQRQNYEINLISIRLNYAQIMIKVFAEMLINVSTPTELMNFAQQPISLKLLFALNDNEVPAKVLKNVDLPMVLMNYVPNHNIPKNKEAETKISIITKINTKANNTITK